MEDMKVFENAISKIKKTKEVEVLMNNKELVVPYEMQGMKAGIIMLAVMIAFLSLICWASTYLYILIGSYFTRVITIALGTIIAFFVITLLYTIWFMWVNNNPAAILSPQGIWVNRFNFIPWDDVQSCHIYTYPGTPIEAVTIVVKDLKKLSKQANIGGKITIFWSKLFHYPPIIIANTTIENEHIISYAQAYIKESE